MEVDRYSKSGFKDVCNESTVKEHLCEYFCIKYKLFIHIYLIIVDGKEENVFLYSLGFVF